jgi:chaperonin GroES
MQPEPMSVTGCMNFRESQGRSPASSLFAGTEQDDGPAIRGSTVNPKTNQPSQPSNMATNIKPLGTRVLVKRIESDEQKSEGGIFLPDTAKEKPQEAEVLALGNGKNDEGETIEFSVAVGDKVLISKYGGTEVKLNGEECLLLSEGDILGILVD